MNTSRKHCFSPRKPCFSLAIHNLQFLPAQGDLCDRASIIPADESMIFIYWFIKQKQKMMRPMMRSFFFLKHFLDEWWWIIWWSFDVQQFCSVNYPIVLSCLTQFFWGMYNILQHPSESEASPGFHRASNSQSSESSRGPRLPQIAGPSFAGHLWSHRQVWKPNKKDGQPGRRAGGCMFFLWLHGPMVIMNQHLVWTWRIYDHNYPETKSFSWFCSWIPTKKVFQSPICKLIGLFIREFHDIYRAHGTGNLFLDIWWSRLIRNFQVYLSYGVSEIFYSW